MQTDQKKPIDIKIHELSWLFTDAVGLYHLGRKYSSLLLLLCAVDALAKKVEPKNKGVRQRFEDYLMKNLPRHTNVQNFNIRVPKKNKTFRLENLLYKFLRNPIIHEGAHLDIRKPSIFSVYIDWTNGARYIQVDNELNRVVLGGDWLIDILGGVVKDGLGETLNKCNQGQG